ncbi:MAG: LacI family transcriptional regulator [Actinomycetota bacterium]|nr:LacI family transcriptional regulator [Actinomycetota bacterium]
MYEVARRSGVSTATVSRVMRDGRGFSAATRERVLATVGELGWVPNGSARGLVSKRVGIVGLLFPDLARSGDAEEDSPLYVDQVIRGAERAATAAGDAVLIAATLRSSGRQLAYSLASKVDGLVVLASSLADEDLASIARSVPVVLLAARAGHDLDSVGADNRAGTRELTSHLIQAHGHRDLAFVSGPAGAPDSVERFEGYRDALVAAGLPSPPIPDADGGFTETGGRRAMKALLAHRESPPQAVVFANDQMAIGSMEVIRSAALRVPADMAVTGFDDISLSRHLRPALTTVSQPMRELGEQAVRLLLDRIDHPRRQPRSVVLPTEIVIRRSCGCRGPAGARRQGRSAT